MNSPWQKQIHSAMQATEGDTTIDGLTEPEQFMLMKLGEKIAKDLWSKEFSFTNKELDPYMVRYATLLVAAHAAFDHIYRDNTAEVIAEWPIERWCGLHAQIQNAVASAEEFVTIMKRTERHVAKMHGIAHLMHQLGALKDAKDPDMDSGGSPQGSDPSEERTH